MELVENQMNSELRTRDEKNNDAMKNIHPLTPEQLRMVDYQLYAPKSTMYNLYTLLKFDKTLFDVNKVANALENAIKNHPAILTTYSFNDSGEIVQKYSPEIFEEIKVEKMSDEDFNQIKDSLLYPFKIIESKMYRARVFETEKAGYFFFDVHHTLFDASSLKVFLRNMGFSYNNKPMEKDYYYLTLQEREDQEYSELYNKSKDYFERTYDRYKWSTKPNIDFKSDESVIGEWNSSIGLDQESIKKVESLFGITRNEFFISAFCLAIALYNKQPNIKISWIYDGREEEIAKNTVGLMYKDLPIAFKFDNEKTIKDIYLDAQEQIQDGIKHCSYPYIAKTMQDETVDMAYFLYQKDIRSSGGLDKMNIETIDIRQVQVASQTILDLEVLDGKDNQQIMINYAMNKYSNESMTKFRDLFIKVSHTLLECIEEDDITIEEIKKKIDNKESLLQKFFGVFSKKM